MISTILPPPERPSQRREPTEKEMQAYREQELDDQEDDEPAGSLIEPDQKEDIDEEIGEKAMKLLIDLRQFIGTEHYYKHMLGGIYTDGVKFLANEACAYWLLDAIFSYNRKEEFQIWELIQAKDGTWLLTMKEPSGRPAIIEQRIPFSNFPLKKIKFYLADGVLMLPVGELGDRVTKPLDLKTKRRLLRSKKARFLNPVGPDFNKKKETNEG